MRVYITCELDETSGYIKHLDLYDNVESAINRAKVILKDDTYIRDEERNDYLNQFEFDANVFLRNGFMYEDQLRIVRIVVKDM